MNIIKNNNWWRLIKTATILSQVLIMIFAYAALADNVTIVPQNGSGYLAKDSNGASLPTGCIVQLISGETISPPDGSGNPTGSNVLLAANSLNGAGTYYFNVNGVPNGIRVFLRVWSSSSKGDGYYFGNSSLHTVSGTISVPDDYVVNEHITANKTRALATTVTPSSRGQGAQSQTLSITGTFITSDATVSYSGTGVTLGTPNVVSGTEIQISASLNQSATSGNFKVTNPSAASSDAVAFTVNPGPDAAAPSPASLYPGDSGQTVVLSTQGSGIFNAGILVTFESNTNNKISYTVSRQNDNTVNLTGFSIAPSAAQGTRTITLTNTDAGTDTTASSFTISTPSLGNLSTTTGVKGNTFTGLSIVGTGTHFLSGTNTVTLGSESDKVIISNVSASDDTHLSFDLSVSPEAATSNPTLTISTANVVGETQTVTKSNAFDITAPSIANTTEANVGDVVTISVVGTGTHFNASAPTISFADSGIAVSNIVVNSATSVQFTATIPTSVTAGTKAITIETAGVVGGTETIRDNDFMVVTAPSFSSITPSTGSLGDTNTIVRINGAGTHFSQANSTVTFSNPGITVNSKTVTSTTSVEANITIAAGAATGNSNATVQTTSLTAGGTETITGSNAFSVATPETPGVVTDLRALAESSAGSITLRWTNPSSANYSGARVVYTNSFGDWDGLTTSSLGPIDVSGNSGAPSTREITSLATGEVQYFKVFSYRTSGGTNFYNSSGVKVAAVPMQATGEGTVALSKLITFETGSHGINHFSMPFASPWYVYGTNNVAVTFNNFAGSPTNEVVTAYDLIKAINVAANNTNVVSAFDKWLGPTQTPPAQGLKIAGNNPEPDRIALNNITLENGISYQLYISTPITLKIKNTP